MSSIVVSGDTSGTITVSAPSVAGSNTLTLPASTGTVGLIAQGIAVATTSGTSIDFTGIPSWVKRITVMFNGVSTNGSSLIQVQLGSGSPTTTGYIVQVASIAGTNAASSSPTTGFQFANSNAATYAWSGLCILCNLTSNLWIGMCNVGTQTGTYTGLANGSISLSGVLDRIRITTVNGTDTFDAGSVNIMYQG